MIVIREEYTVCVKEVVLPVLKSTSEYYFGSVSTSLICWAGNNLISFVYVQVMVGEKKSEIQKTYSNLNV